MDLFYILNRKSNSSSTIKEFPPKVIDGLDSRRSELYKNLGKTLVIQGNFDDEFYEPDINFPRISVYAYEADFTPPYNQGTLVSKN